ncbi:MAG TPA: carboxypeptidase-like regulatory domain-containing protein, partial [Candidatus Dormibacteraeota bacterium]|nr:carboxypeptidase-like regulatory domain-containing protein [Candidatus Dormibacteraeota bacterium]
MNGTVFRSERSPSPKPTFSLLALLLFLAAASNSKAQDTLTGAFEGIISDGQTGAAIEGATAEIINQQTGLVIQKRTDSRGRFYQGLLAPGLYTIRVSMPGYQTREVIQRLKITYTGEVIPVPVSLDPLPAVAATTPTPAPALTEEQTDVPAGINRTDGRRGGSFSEEEVSRLPIGSTTLVRSFDELSLLLPGVAPPPQTLGSVAGPGVGPGVGSAGQFAVNGLRSRANNFTVDGSDNNDEDIGVRRQGFVALIPQPIESIKEYQAITLLPPAQFGRNIGAQVNAVSKSGGSAVHGTLYGFFNSSQLNARNFFDHQTASGSFPLTAGNNQPVLLCPPDNQRCLVNGQPNVAGGERIIVRNPSGRRDSFTFIQTGGVIGGPLIRDRMFYFFSGEGQIINASQKESFAVPTVDERGFNRSGATGIFQNPSPFAGGAVIAYPT